MKALSLSARGSCLAFLLLLVGFVLSGCTSISVRTHEYLGVEGYAPVSPEHVEVLEKEPARDKVRLGELIVTADGEPPRDKIEEKLKKAGAQLGADAVFIVYDRTHLYPIVYVDWWGPSTVTQGANRNVVGIAVKYK